MQLGSGGTMGDTNEPEAFMANFYRTIEGWILDAYKKYAKELVYDATEIVGRITEREFRRVRGRPH